MWTGCGEIIYKKTWNASYPSGMIKERRYCSNQVWILD
jgi:hypothetical protein